MDGCLPRGGVRRTQELRRGHAPLLVNVLLLAFLQELPPAALDLLAELALNGLTVLQEWGAHWGLWGGRQRVSQLEVLMGAVMGPTEWT